MEFHGWNKYLARRIGNQMSGDSLVEEKNWANQAIRLVAIFSIIACAPMARAQSRSLLGSCSLIVDRNGLLVTGTRTANVIEIVGGERGVQVTCDGAMDTFSRIRAATIEAGDGDDTVHVDNSSGFLEVIKIFGEGGTDSGTFLVGERPPSNELFYGWWGGTGADNLGIVGSALADGFDVRPDAESNSAGVQVTDLCTGVALANINAFDNETLTIKMGAGNDVADVSQVAGTALNILGQGGDDVTRLEVPITIFPTGITLISFIDLGLGRDTFSIVGTSASEDYKILGTPDREIDPQILVTDLLTGKLAADVHVQQTEEMMIETGDGDDRVELNWDAALMSGLSLIQANLGRGNDTFESNLVAVLAEPPTNQVQTARFEVEAGPGDDQVAFSDSAASWFNVFFTVDTGRGADLVDASLFPAPDDGVPGPPGSRQVQLNMVTGGNDDFVRFQNQTNGDVLNVFLFADLGGGNDIFEGLGEIHDASISPGRGLDTARVTRNLLPFVAEFEKVENLD